MKKEIDILDIMNSKQYQDAIGRNIELQERIHKAIKKLTFLIDVGFDYDGYRDAENLMALIDELVFYANESREILRGIKTKKY